MKKSRIAKFALLGASTAALAATLSTSTYAWYVSNKTAKVATTQGSSAAAGADGSITLSKTGKYGTFYNEISLGSFVNAGLLPAVTNDGRTFMSLSENASTKVATPDQGVYVAVLKNNPYDTNQCRVFEYEFYIMSDGDVTVRPTVSITNTTASFTSQVNYTGVSSEYKEKTGLVVGASAAGLYTKSGDNYIPCAASAVVEDGVTYYYVDGDSKVQGVSGGQEFYVNALNAMSLSFWTIEGDDEIDSTTKETTYTDDPVIKGFQQLSTSTSTDFVKCTTTNTIPTPVAVSGAQDYYEAISKYTLTDNNTFKAKQMFTSNKSFDTFELHAGVPTKLQFFLWLDGASDLCFNACEQQSFEVGFDFSVTGA